jgi:phospholipase C
MPRLKNRLATNIFPFAQFEKDAADGMLPDFSLIEPNLVAGHSDYHPAISHAMGIEIPIDPPSSILGGEAFLARIYDITKSASSPTGSNAYNTLFFIGWDEPGGTYDHVPPGAVPPPDPSAPAGQFGFTFERSGYRTPAIIVSPWVDEGLVINDEYRHTSMLATLRKAWGLGDPFTQRDAAARTFDHLLSRDAPRDPATWPAVEARPVPDFHWNLEVMNSAVGPLGKALGAGFIDHVQAAGIPVPPEMTDPTKPPTAEQFIAFLRTVAAAIFPTLAAK